MKFRSNPLQACHFWEGELLLKQLHLSHLPRWPDALQVFQQIREGGDFGRRGTYRNAKKIEKEFWNYYRIILELYWDEHTAISGSSLQSLSTGCLYWGYTENKSRLVTLTIQHATVTCLAVGKPPATPRRFLVDSCHSQVQKLCRIMCDGIELQWSSLVSVYTCFFPTSKQEWHGMAAWSVDQETMKQPMMSNDEDE